jgi:hypothetical protein
VVIWYASGIWERMSARGDLRMMKTRSADRLKAGTPVVKPAPPSQDRRSTTADRVQQKTAVS